jgi:ABC-type Na+ efflux pump permease subunit
MKISSETYQHSCVVLGNIHFHISLIFSFVFGQYILVLSTYIVAFFGSKVLFLSTPFKLVKEHFVKKEVVYG